MQNPQSFTSLRVAIFAALGLGLAGCDSSVDVVATSDAAGSTGGVTGGSTGGLCPGGTGSGSSGTNYGGAPSGAACEGAQAILTTEGAYSGYARCPDGSIHRIESVACNAALCVKPCAGIEQGLFCETDAECAQTPYGTCGSFPSTGNAPGDSCSCANSCATNADCGAGKVCVCSGTLFIDESWSVCASAGCETGDDCASGECGVTTWSDGCGRKIEIGCRTASDTCHVDADCAEGACRPAGDGSGWHCISPGVVCGRPLLVGGESRTAPSRTRGDWARAGATPDVSALDPALRGAIAAHWQDVAALEHASIASFARFTLQLLALGAPPELLADTQRAAADEVEHARAAFAIASAYAGRPIGPAALDVGCLPVATDLGDVLCALVEEACVGETMGVAEAVILAEAAVDPVLRGVQARIAEDELRHAALAWRALQWGLAQASAEVRRRVAETFERAMAAVVRAPEPRERVAREHGLLSAEEIVALRRQAVRDVVLPCARALAAVGGTAPRSADGHCNGEDPEVMA